MKNWKLVILILGIVLIIAAFAVYVARIESCYPPGNVYSQFSPEQAKGFREACQLDNPIIIQFGNFLFLFIPGLILFSAYWLMTRPRVKNRRAGQLSGFLLLLMVDSLLVMFFGLLNYPAPGVANGPAAWAVEVIATLGFLCYVAALALWHWKRWGLPLFQGASITLAIFILLGGSSLVLAAVIIAGVIGLSLLLRPIQEKLT
jgi:hypothetical protein